MFDNNKLEILGDAVKTIFDKLGVARVFTCGAIIAAGFFN